MFSSLNVEPFGIYKSNTIPVQIPIPEALFELFESERLVTIPTLVITPKSPSYKSTVFSSLTYVGGAIKTTGGAAEV